MFLLKSLKTNAETYYSKYICVEHASCCFICMYYVSKLDKMKNNFNKYVIETSHSLNERLTKNIKKEVSYYGIDQNRKQI